MGKVNYKKLYRSIKLYPIFYGLTADLIFWIAINTLFLTTVKHLSASQINSIEAIGTAVGLIFQLFLIKIVRKIGNLNSVRLGTILLFLSVLLDTISTKYIGFLVAELCYVIGFVFKHMDNVILIKNLSYLNKSEEYIKYQTKGSTIYSFITLIISIISGLIFNINPYIPMIICLLICFNNIILTFFIYEVPINVKKEVIKEKNISPKFDKKIILMILLYGLFYAMIACGQKNSKLFIQFNMQGILTLNNVAIYMSVFIFISRIARLTSNLIFMKIYNKFKNKMLFILEMFLTFSFCFLLIGNFIKNMIGIWIMAIGFFTYLFIRDPFDNYMKKTLFEHSSELVHDKIINYLNLVRKIFSLIYSSIVALMLFNLNYIYVMSVLLILSGMFILLIIKINNLIIRGDKNELYN
jgi:hypothetical protein